MNETAAPVIETETKSVRFPSHKRHDFDKRLRAFNRKAARFGLPAATIVDTSTELIWFADDGRKVTAGSTFAKYSVEITIVNLIASRIAVAGGFRVVGSIEPLPGVDHRIVSMMDKTVPVKQFEKHDMHCDHCNTLRPRNSVIILKNKDGEIKTVGKSCLKSYTGIDPESALMPAATASLNFDDDFEGARSSGFYGYGVKQVIEAALAVIRVEKGYVKSGQDDFGSTPTSAMVMNKLIGWVGNASHLNETYKTLDDDKVKAELIINQWKAIDLNTETNDFNRKLGIFAQSGACPIKMIGTVCGGVAYWIKSSNKPKTEKLPSDFVGNKQGDKMTADVTVERVNSYDGQFGSVWIINMLVNGKDKLVWFASGNSAYGLINDYGEPIPGTHKIKFTIKGHKDDPKWGKQTSVTRVKVL